jgi:hypothetical protein
MKVLLLLVLFIFIQTHNSVNYVRWKTDDCSGLKVSLNATGGECSKVSDNVFVKFQCINNGILITKCTDENCRNSCQQEQKIKNECIKINGIPFSYKIEECQNISTEPKEPVTPSNPTYPVNPTDPTNPTNPTEPTEPEDPTELEDPTEPEDPTDPTDPTETTTEATRSN